MGVSEPDQYEKKVFQARLGNRLFSRLVKVPRAGIRADFPRGGRGMPTYGAYGQCGRVCAQLKFPEAWQPIETFEELA